MKPVSWRFPQRTAPQRHRLMQKITEKRLFWPAVIDKNKSSFVKEKLEYFSDAWIANAVFSCRIG